MENMMITMKAIGQIHSPYTEKFGIPRQSGLAESVVSYITFVPECHDTDCFRGIEEYSHLWLLWGFSENKVGHWSATVRPPRLGGNQRKGVFATRSPFRPNPIGLSCVKYEKIEKTEKELRLYISGADLMDGTPIYDIKPYIPYTDSRPDASYEFAREALKHRLKVHVSDPEILQMFNEDQRKGLLEALSLDPRPSYQNDPERIYGMKYMGYNVKFNVSGDMLYVLEIRN